MLSGKPIKPSFKATIERHGADPLTVTVTGRTAWALLSLLRTGEAGCTPISRPALRWSDYIFKLRKQGVSVETIDEKHGGSFAGQHAKYILRDRVTVSGGNLDAYLASPEGQREFPYATFARAA